jgi:DnaJ homolog subfamily A member 2
MTDYYKILGVNRNATKVEITKSYRTLAMQWHPDKHDVNNQEMANIKFKEIAEAYHVLTDPEKKRIYDMHGIEALQRSNTGGFRPMFVQPNMAHNIVVLLSDFYVGKLLKFHLKLTKMCIDCNGLGCNDVNKMSMCKVCMGKGKIMKNMPVAPGMPFMVQQVIPCNNCFGRGKIFSVANECQTCRSMGKVKIDVVSEYYVKKGEEYGIKMVENMGDYLPDGSRGVLQLTLIPDRDLDTKGYGREGDDLVYEMKISLKQALLGFKVDIPYINPAEPYLRLTSNNIINPGMIKFINGRGMPIKNSNGFGNLIISFEIIFPTENFSTSVKSQLEKYLPTIPNSHLLENNMDVINLDTAVLYEKPNFGRDSPEQCNQQ